MSEGDEPVLTERRDGILLITLNRPEARNAVNAAVAEGVAAALDDLDADDELSVGVLTGAGKGFSSGMDLKAGARRNKLLGLWVADRLGITGDAAAAYAKEVIAAEFDGTGDNGVIRKVMGDFGSKGFTLDEVELRAKMTELMAEAIAQVKAGV